MDESIDVLGDWFYYPATEGYVREQEKLLKYCDKSFTSRQKFDMKLTYPEMHKGLLFCASILRA